MQLGRSNLSENHSSFGLTLAFHSEGYSEHCCCNTQRKKKKAISLFTPSCMMVCLNSGLQMPPPVWCQCVKCQHGRVHWLASHKNMPSSCVMVFAAPPCEGKHIKHTHAHVICARVALNCVCLCVCVLFDKHCRSFRSFFWCVVAELRLMKKNRFRFYGMLLPRPSGAGPAV